MRCKSTFRCCCNSEFQCAVGYRHVDFRILPVYRISSVSIVSSCYPMVCALLPVTCGAHPVDRGVWRSRSRLSSGIQVMEIWMKVFVQQEHSYGDLEQRLCPMGTKLWRYECSPSGILVMEIWIKVFVQRDQSLRPVGTEVQRLEFRL